jgi:hypothetical protein
MQILKRAKGKTDGDFTAFNVPEEQVKEEVDRRTAKAGYTTRHGEPIYGTKIMSPGIGQSKLNVWPRDKNGNLIGD